MAAKRGNLPEPGPSGIKKSYSSVAKGKSAIIIQPKDTTQAVQTTKSDLLQYVDPVSENLHISGVKNIRNGGMLVGCSSDDDSRKLRQIAVEKLADKYEIKEVSSFHPRVRIAGMTCKLPEGDVIKSIRAQNKEAFTEHSQCKVVEIKPIKKRSDIYQAVINLDMDTYNKDLSVCSSKLFVGYDVCDVFDAIDIKRCFNCSGFSHYSKECKSKKFHCPRCSENHLVKNCKATSLKCINCMKSNNERNTEFDAAHAAWDSRCPYYLQRIEEFKSRLIFS
ncbi:unnamed protein product [Acanthoscelides obtectus]|uniref:CCHC-type domain-containing protein n=1 Tax=Acanthoscelides obtectus TaxID=200917 RepID=A0A9P0KZI3_ACAOB|nr:unnamed protein product [Acanthoscelides obtectus]CAK1656709.1 hypothetical protein AOBTE_LOCUS19880 [Acanthoscelides obtectus]